VRMNTKGLRILIGVVFIICVGVGGTMVFQSTDAKSETNQSHINPQSDPKMNMDRHTVLRKKPFPMKCYLT